MQLTTKMAKTLIMATAVLMLSVPVMAGNGHGPGDGTGTSDGPQDGTGNGPGTGDCLNSAVFTLDHSQLLARGGNGNGNGGERGGHGPGDGTGNGGDGPQDGTGFGPGTGDCLNGQVIQFNSFKLVYTRPTLNEPLFFQGGLRSMYGNKAKQKDNILPEITQQVVDDLIQLREEEKLARDVYLYLYTQWGQWIFSNISTSEQQHMDAVGILFDRYNIKDPVDIDIQGQFKNQDLQDLYDALIATGTESMEDAQYVGAAIEDLDLYDIYEMIENATSIDDVTSVYENLSKGSRNHLRSFVGQLVLFNEDYVYEAQYLTQEEVDEIIVSPMEAGRP